jgi:hypothetical protein
MSLPCPASHYMNGLHEVVRRDWQRSDQNAHIPSPFARLWCDALLHVNRSYSGDSHVIFLLAPGNQADKVDDSLDLARPFTQLVLARFG